MAPTRTCRLALLLCDTPIDSVKSIHGTYHDIFQTYLSASLLAFAGETGGVEMEMRSYDVVNKGEFPSEEELKGLDGVVITGSAASAYDDEQFPWIPSVLDFLRQVADNWPKIKMIGICFGLQLLVRAYGGEVVKSPKGWEIGTYTLNLTLEGRKLLLPDASSDSASTTVEIQQMHADHATALPPKGDFQLLGSTPKSKIQAIASYYPDELSKLRVLAFQGHPEFTPSIVEKVIDRRSSLGVFSLEMTAEARERAVRRDDGKGRLGAAIWKCLLEQPFR